MNNLNDVLNEYDIKYNKLNIINKVYILDTNIGKIVYKNNTNNIYDYLNRKDFTNYPRLINNNICLQEYIESIDVSSNEKCNELVKLIANLHRKTTTNKDIDIDNIKEIYESIKNNNINIKKYYNDLNNYIDTIIFMSPSEYLLIRNIDKINYLIKFIDNNIDNWYKLVTDSNNIKYSLVHNNISLDHVLISKDNSYLISFDNSKIDYSMYDLIDIIKYCSHDNNIEDIINNYSKINKINNLDYLFILLNLSIVKEIKFTNNTYLDCYNLTKYIDYIDKVIVILNKYLNNNK